MGRPPKSPGHKRDKRMVIMLTENEQAAIDTAAKGADAESVSGWARDVLLDAAGNNNG